MRSSRFTVAALVAAALSVPAPAGAADGEARARFPGAGQAGDARAAGTAAATDPTGDGGGCATDGVRMDVAHSDVVTLSATMACAGFGAAPWTTGQAATHWWVDVNQDDWPDFLVQFVFAGGSPSAGVFEYQDEVGPRVCALAPTIGGATVSVTAPRSCFRSAPTVSVVTEVSPSTAAASDWVPDNIAFVGPVRDTLSGYWLLGQDGGVFSYGNAKFHGSTGGIPLNEPVVSMAAKTDGSGYWFVASDGGIFAFKAPFHGSMGGTPLNEPVVGMAAKPDASGYWLVASDGGIFAFKAPFHGSMGGIPLNQPIVGMAALPDGSGYWMVAEDGGIFAFGDAPFFGSMGGRPISAPIVAIANHGSTGYWLLQADGVVHAFGSARPLGSVEGELEGPFFAIAPLASGFGYRVANVYGEMMAFGDADWVGDAGELPLNAPVVGMAAIG